MKKLPLNVWVLTAAQALMMSVSSMVVFIGGLIGAELSTNDKLATLPAACIILGTALTVVPVTMLMKKIGRRNAFLYITTFSIFVALLSSYAIQISSFYLFCFGAFLFGSTTACVLQFRFAAMESVTTDQIPKAASTVLLGGIASAFIGPEIATYGKDLLSTSFAGSFVLLSILFIISLGVLLVFKNPLIHESKSDSAKRSLKDISKQSVFWVAILAAAIGYAVMSFIMTATPVSMHVIDGHSLHNTKWVIQSHILAMFLPSLITGLIIQRIGVTKMMITGLLSYLLCIAIAFSGHQLTNYWISLILLGLGWNFLFIGGTTLLPQSYRSNERFKVQAINEFIVFGTQATAALSSGWFVFAVGWESMLLFTLPIIFFLMSVIIRWAIRIKSKAPVITE